MKKRYIGIASCLFVTAEIMSGHAPTAIHVSQASYGILYIENNTTYTINISAKVKDEWDVVTETFWNIGPSSAEKIDNLSKLSEIYFWPEIEDASKAANWLKQKSVLNLKSHEPSKALIVTIAPNPYQPGWNIDQRYVNAAKIQYGGTSGYKVETIVP
jgi:hypothetical protein